MLKIFKLNRNFFLKRISWWRLPHKSWKQLSYWTLLLRYFQGGEKIKDILLTTLYLASTTIWSSINSLVFVTSELMLGSNLQIQIYIGGVFVQVKLYKAKLDRTWFQSYYGISKSPFTNVLQLRNVLSIGII